MYKPETVNMTNVQGVSSTRLLAKRPRLNGWCGRLVFNRAVTAVDRCSSRAHAASGGVARVGENCTHDIPYELGIGKGRRFPLQDCCLDAFGRLI